MARRYFGTDGVRGLVGEAPMTVDFALRLASASTRVLLPEGGTVVIGKDTRVSGYMFEAALEAGFVAAGADVKLLGPMPTPGIAFFCQVLDADLGVVISASHNPYHDNGIKFFARGGGKLPDEHEIEIEALLDEPILTRASQRLGRAQRINAGVNRYKDFCLSTISSEIDFRGFKIVVDCGHGAAYKVGPRVLNDLGATVIPIGCSPNGQNINDGCGSTSLDFLRHTVCGIRADVGIAFDGDGDRCIMVDHTGEPVDGDGMLFAIAKARQEESALVGPVVGTVMSNLGLEHALNARNIDFRRAKVGDRNVLAMLKEHGGILGGESSGHIICLDRTTTGDGIVSALQVLAAVRRNGVSLREYVSDLSRFPQKMVNVPIDRRIDIDTTVGVQKTLREVETRLGNDGRVVLRASGTEPVIRVMVEGKDANVVEQSVNELAESVSQAARKAS